MNSLRFTDLEKVTSKIKQVLCKAQIQFQERQHNIQSDYITDLRKYSNIVTVCEEQLILNLREFDLAYLGEIVKTLSGFHLIILNNLLLWIQQFQLHLSPNPRNTPFEILIHQSINGKSQINKINQSRASQEMSSIGDFIHKLSMNSKSLIDSHPSPRDAPQGFHIMEEETEKMKDNIKNSKSVLKKLLIMKKRMNRDTQTNLNGFDIIFLQEQNQELKQLIQTTTDNYETKLKDLMVKYKESKLILKAQKSELEHQMSIIEVQTDEIERLRRRKQVPNLIKKFIKIPTIEEKNKRFSISQDHKNRSVVYSNSKVRSTSLPRIERSFDSVSKKLDSILIKNTIPSLDNKQLYQKLLLPQDQYQFLKACQYVALQVPNNLFDNQDGGESPKYNQFSKIMQQLKVRHSQCMPKCDHLSFLL